MAALFLYDATSLVLRVLVIAVVLILLVFAFRAGRRRVELQGDQLTVFRALRPLVFDRDRVRGAEVRASEMRVVADLCHVVTVLDDGTEVELAPLMGYVFFKRPNRRLNSQAEAIGAWAGAH